MSNWAKDLLPRPQARRGASALGRQVAYGGWLRNPNHQLIGCKNCTIYWVSVSTIRLVVQDFATINSVDISLRD